MKKFTNLYILDRNQIIEIDKFNERKKFDHLSIIKLRLDDSHQNCFFPILSIAEGSTGQIPTRENLEKSFDREIKAIKIFFKHAVTNHLVLELLKKEVIESRLSNIQTNNESLLISLTEQLQEFLLENNKKADCEDNLNKLLVSIPNLPDHSLLFFLRCSSYFRT